MKIAAQLFTVREFAKDLASLSETLSRVADMGYTAVQLSGICDYQPEWMAEQLKKNGLTCPVTHTPFERIVAETDTVLAEHRQFGCGLAGIGGAPGVWDERFDYEGFRDKLIPVMDRFKVAGMRFGYHNHHVEFNRTGGRNILERLAEDLPKDVLTFILDTYWVQYAGADPAVWIRRFPGQMQCVHFKDMEICWRDQRMAPVGAGNMNWPSIIAACEEAGTEYAVVEQDECYGADPFECLQSSAAYLKAQGLK